MRLPLGSARYNNLMEKQTAIFAGGCFWCTEELFKNLKGIVKVTSGYTGGDSDYPDYQEVSGGQSGHAEAVVIEFNPHRISFEDLLNVFFHTHNPTTLNQQGNDVGIQYRSAIFYTNPEQKKQAEDFIKKLEEEKAYDAPIVTEVTEAKRFFPAEDYHQNYYKRNKSQPYCQIVIGPKVEKLRQGFESLIDLDI